MGEYEAACRAGDAEQCGECDWVVNVDDAGSGTGMRRVTVRASSDLGAILRAEELYGVTAISVAWKA